MAPSFSPAAAQAYRTLSGMGIDVTNVRIILVDLGGSIALDTVVAFPVGRDTLTVDMPVSVDSRGEQFNATVQLRDATGAVQFSSTLRVTARDANLPAGPPIGISLKFVGPGFTARTIAVTPADGTMLPTATADLLATAADSSGRPVPDLIVTWTSSDTTIARVTSTGNTTARITARGPRGPVTFTAKATSGVTGSGIVTILPVPARLVTISGGGQTGVAGQTLASSLVVELQGTDGKPIANTLVVFRAVTANGDVGVVNQQTDANGRAATTLKLGRTAGSYTYEATSSGLAALTVSQTATAAPIGPPTQLVPLSAIPTSFKVGVAPAQRFSAQLADANGYYVQQAGVAITATMVVSPGNATTSATSTSDAAGVISFALPAFNSTGSVTITLTSPTIPNLPYGTFPITP